MIYLLGLIEHINKHGGDQGPPPTGKVKASREVEAFSKTLEVLYRMVRSANFAFFVGELDFAHRVLVDSLRLFRRLDNKKAIGIASNNIGNILLGIYREMKASKLDRLYGLTTSEVVAQGIAHFHNAIQLGEKAYDEFYEMQGWSPSCLDFMQHLANRYFNRGIFLLHVKNDHKNPREIEQLGFRDLKIASDMDQEVTSYGQEIGWGSADRAEKRFNVNLVRIRGFNILYDLGYNYDWGVEQLIDDTADIIRTEYNNIDSELFSKMSLAGRMQELEIQLMRYYVIHHDIETSAKVAVRMIIEDERIFTEALRLAMDVLITYSESCAADTEFRDKMVPTLRSYQKVVVDLVNQRRRAAKDDLDSISASITKSNGASSILAAGRDNSQPFSSPTGDESSLFVTMEDF